MATALLFGLQFRQADNNNDPSTTVVDSTTIDSLVNKLPAFDLPEGYFIKSAGYSSNTKNIKLVALEDEGQMILLVETEDQDTQGITTLALQQVMRIMDSFTTISSRDTSYLIADHEYDFIYSEGFRESQTDQIYKFFGFFNDLKKPLIVMAYGPVELWDAQVMNKFINSIQIDN